MVKELQHNLQIPVKLSNILLLCFVMSLFLVGSCKTSELADSNNNKYGLLPDPVSKEYTPARGYSYTARNYIAHNPDALLHMTEMQVKYILGSPGITWRENPAEVWQYRGQNCTLDVYFYKEDLSDSWYVLSEERGLSHHRKVSYYEMRQLGRPEWARGSGAASTSYLPSKIRSTNRISKCISNIVSKT